MNNPKISVIMSVKNGESDLAKSIGSIQAQTMPEWELIVCDDGSTDKTLCVLKDFESKDKRIRVIHNDKSKGAAEARNQCIALTKCGIIAVQDADDESDMLRFEKQLSFMEQHPEFSIVGTCWYNVDEQGNKWPSDVPYMPSAKDQVKGGLFMHPSWMMRKEDVKKVGYYTVNKHTLRSQDYHLALKVLGAGMKMCNMPERLYYYYVDDNTKMRSLSWKRVIGNMWVRWDGYRRNHLPIWCYIYVFKPLLTNLLPKKVMMNHYAKVYNQQKTYK